jgi:hypothetical protein
VVNGQAVLIFCYNSHLEFLLLRKMACILPAVALTLGNAFLLAHVS